MTTFEELRKDFPKGTVGLLPKPTKRDAQKGHCNVCGGYHGLPAVHLDYVGHAAVTDRLLTVDPSWTWEPLALDAQGLPALDRDGNFWIRLTVLGVSRIGVGDGSSMKERIGDALRNAAMRFGVALSLWTKEELESGFEEAKPPQPKADPETGEIAQVVAQVEVPAGTPRGKPPTLRRREPPHQPPPGRHVTALYAKKTILEELHARGIGEDAAKNTAKAMWGDRGSAPISETDLQGLIDSLGPVEMPEED